MMATLAFNESIIFAESFVLDVWLGFEYGLKIQKPLIEHIYECFEVTYLIRQNTGVLTQQWVKYARIMVFAYTCFLI